MKTIKFYTKEQYGNRREFIHPDNASDASLVQRLTGQKTVDMSIRLCIQQLSAGTIEFTEVVAPK